MKAATFKLCTGNKHRESAVPPGLVNAAFVTRHSASLHAGLVYGRRFAAANTNMA